MIPTSSTSATSDDRAQNEDTRSPPAAGEVPHQEEQPAGMTLGLLAAPELPATLARQLAADLPHRLSPNAGSWRVCLSSEPLLADTGGSEAIIAAGAEAGRRQAWDAVICLTDVPLRAGRHPLVAGVWPADRVGVVAIPAFGPVRLRARLLEATIRLLSELADDGRVGAALLDRRRLAEVLIPIRRVHSKDDRVAVRYVLPPVLGHGRLVAGMVRANRPWRTFMGLWHAVLVALGTAAYATLNATVWQLSGVLGWPRLLGVMVASLGLLIVWLIISHDLWERPQSEESRTVAALYNAATVLTVGIATLCAYLVLLVLLLLASALIVDSGLLAKQLHHAARVTDYLALGWLAASIATVAGAIGSGLDSVDAVREAAYGHNQRRRQTNPQADEGDERSES